MSKINEDIFTAIDLIVGKRLEEISYDITKPYTIKEVKENGEYVVYDTSMIFTAYSTEDYKVDDRVYVTIPNGDFNSTKIIIGKEKEYGETGKPYDYVSPEEAIIPLEYINFNNTNAYSLLATGLQRYKTFTKENNGETIYNFNIPQGTTQLEIQLEIKNLNTENDQVYVELETIDTITNTGWSYKIFNDKITINEFGQNINFKFFTLLENDENTYEIVFKDLIAIIPSTVEGGENKRVNLFPSMEIQIPLIENQQINYSNYTRLLIKGNFKTLLPLLTYEGNYGLKLVLGHRAMGAAPDDDLVYTTLLLDNLESMIGNTYRFTDYFEQTQVYDISELGQIVSATLSFYQLDNFKYKASETDINGTPLPYVESTEFGGTLLDNNLFVKDVSIALGYDSSTIEGDYVELYTDNIIYDETTGNKNIKLRWAQKQEDGRYILKTSINSNETINWFVYNVGASSILGENWEQIQIDDENNNATNNFSINYAPNLEKTGDRLRAQVIITKEDGIKEIYTTPTLLLEHRIPVADQATLEATTRFVIISGDNLNGNYYIYGANGRLISTGEASKPRNIYIEDTIKNVKYKYKENIDENGWQSWEQFPSAAGTNNPTISVKWNTIPSEKSMIVDFLNGQYKISSYFTTSKVENNLACTIKQDKRKFYSSTEFRFGIAGSNGSEYTLALSLSNNKNFITTDNTEGAQEEVRINTVILNSENKEIQLSDTKYLTYNLIYNYGISLINTNQLVCPKNTTVNSQSGAIVKVVLSKDAGLTNYDLEAYMPVGLATPNVGYVIGPTEIIYDSYGKPDYYRGPYQIFTKEHLEEEYNPVEADGWNTYSWKKDIDGTLKEIDDDSFKPVIEIKNKEETGRLIASSFYLTNNENYYTISYSDGFNNSFTWWKDIKWSCPIYITQNHYPSSTLNKWDGALKVDDKNNYILTRAFAAGKKNNDDNTFSGVMMGDWSEQITEESITTETGIFGFNKGAQSFGFKDDGTGFIGKSGGGRILFDGEQGTIGTSESNLLIDFVNHTIESKALTIDAEITPGDTFGDTGAKFYLSNTSKKYFEISHLERDKDKNIQESSLIRIGDNTYYLQSQDYSTDKQSGTRIDLDAGKITSYGFTLDADVALPSKVTSDSKDYYGSTMYLSNQSSNYFAIGTYKKKKTSLSSYEYEHKNLIQIGSGNYYLQSADYDTTEGSEAGTKIDLANGKITSYDFTLDADVALPSTVTSGSKDYYGSTMYLSNQSSNYFAIGTYAKKKTGVLSYEYEHKKLIQIGSDNYYLQSADYNSDLTADGYVTAGIHIDLANGNIKSPNFMLTNATADGDTASLKLKGGIDVASGGKIGGWNVGNTTLYSGDGKNKDIEKKADGTVIPGNLINADEKFIVNTNGYLTCYGATLLGGTEGKSSKVIFNNEQDSGGETISVDNFVLENGSYITNKTFRAGMDLNNQISNMGKTSIAAGFVFGRASNKLRLGLTSNDNPFIERTPTDEKVSDFRYIFSQHGMTLTNNNQTYISLGKTTKEGNIVFTKYILKSDNVNYDDYNFVFSHAKPTGTGEKTDAYQLNMGHINFGITKKGRAYWQCARNSDQSTELDYEHTLNFSLNGSSNPYITAFRESTAYGSITFDSASNANVNISDLRTALDTYAPKSWVTGKDYATQSWVNDKDYAPKSWVTDKDYATQSWVTGKGYITWDSKFNGKSLYVWIADFAEKLA